MKQIHIYTCHKCDPAYCQIKTKNHRDVFVPISEAARTTCLSARCDDPIGHADFVLDGKVPEGLQCDRCVVKI